MAALTPYVPPPERAVGMLPHELSQAGLSPYQLWTILSAYRWWIVAVTAAVVCLTFVASKLMPKTYEATATLLIDYKINDPVTGQELSPHLAASYLATQVDLLSGPQILLEVVDRLDWARDPAHTGGYTGESGQGGLREYLAELLKKKLVIGTFKDSRLIRITYGDHDREAAALVANAVVQVYLERSGDFVPNSTLVQTLKSQLVVLETKLAGLSQTLGRNHPERVAVAAELESVRARLELELGTAARADRGRAGTTTDAAMSPACRHEAPYYSIQLATASSETHARARLKEFVGDECVRAELRQSGYMIRAGAWGLRADAEHALENYRSRGFERARVLEMENPVPWIVSDGSAVAPGPAEPPAIASGKYTNATLVSAAQPPLKHSSPRTLVNVVLALFVGAFLGFASALLRELLDRRVRCREDVERDLGMPVLAELGSPKGPRRFW